MKSDGDETEGEPIGNRTFTSYVPGAEHYNATGERPEAYYDWTRWTLLRQEAGFVHRHARSMPMQQRNIPVR